MNNLILFLLGLVFIPACLSQNDDKQCFSLSLKPSYPCCKGNEIVYTDEDGDWGVENNKWCGIGNGHTEKSDESCFAAILGYSCCKECKVVYTDKDGDWGVEKGKWCGIKDSCISPNDIIEEPIQNNTGISNQDFEFSFLKLENNKNNTIYSPLSIEYALKMLQEGACEKTYDEINRVVGNEENSKYANLNKTLSMGNGLFVNSKYYDKIKVDYINILKEKYDAEVEQDELKNAKKINAWVEDKTLGIIKDMLKDDMFNDPFKVHILFIINVLAVDVAWADPFSINNTKGQTFYKDDGTEMEATMMLKGMARSQDIAFYKDDDITVLSMNLNKYNETQFEFMAIMPNENLSTYIENVTKEQINKISENLIPSFFERDGVNIQLPKFKFRYDLELKKDLQILGIEDAFDVKTANFTKMSNMNLYVSDAFHVTDIDLEEKGVKAAASTIIDIVGNIGKPRTPSPVNIIINKPFMFIIRDKNTNDIWFIGTVYEPNKWEDEKEYYELQKSTST